MSNFLKRLGKTERHDRQAGPVDEPTETGMINTIASAEGLDAHTLDTSAPTPPVRLVAPPEVTTLVVRSDTNQRENNEDSFQVFDLAVGRGDQPLTVLAIADGMGGHEHGEHVSREALRKVSLALFEQLASDPAINHLGHGTAPDAEQAGAMLWQAFEQANAHIRRMIETNKWGKAGTTIVVAILHDDDVTVGNIGDSPLFWYHAQTGHLTKVTHDHTVAGVLLDAGLISPEMALVHEGKSRLEFHLGSEMMPSEPTIQKITLNHGDMLLLCTDGVCGSLLTDHIHAVLSDQVLTLDGMADRLLALARERGETDNQTLILWKQHTDGSRPISVRVG